MVGLFIFGALAASLTLYYSGGGDGDGILIPFCILMFPFVMAVSFIVFPIMSLLQFQPYTMTVVALIMYIQYPIYGLYIIKGSRRGKLKGAGIILILHCLATIIIGSIYLIV
jgi:hypothetical protein